MKKTTKVAPPYSILFISGPGLGEFMEPTGAHLQWSDTLISIGCLYCYDGETTLTLGPTSEVSLKSAPVFDGEIRTENRRIVVSTAYSDIVLSADVPALKTRVRIWENHPTQPDDIVIGYG